MDDFERVLRSMEKEKATEINEQLVIDPDPELYPHKAGEPVEKYFKPVYITREELYFKTKRKEKELEEKEHNMILHAEKMAKRKEMLQDIEQESLYEE